MMMSNERFQLEKGDVMLIYTDGITEALKKEGVAGETESDERMFGQERLAAILKEPGSQSPEQIKEEILQALEDYESDDDITMIVLKRVKCSLCWMRSVYFYSSDR